MRLCWISGNTNVADLLTKPVTRKIWDQWSGLLFDSSWIAEYIVQLVQMQLGVSLVDWEPTVDGFYKLTQEEERELQEHTEYANYETIFRVAAVEDSRHWGAAWLMEMLSSEDGIVSFARKKPLQRMVAWRVEVRCLNEFLSFAGVGK